MNAVLPNRTINQLDNSGKIKSQHLSRKAIIYIRQSTLQQVHRHQESTRLQYGLVDRAILLGWPRSDIEVIDDDLGCSGATIAGRQGFQRLVAEVGLDHVGMVLGLEMSRLSRSSRDWLRIPVKVATQSTGKLPLKPVKAATPSERSDAGGIFLLYLVSCRQICLLFSE